ncbi:MAG: hypothetical protein KDJ14_00845 [Xanthomonadales bacterium]|nr:hypothetical protein [Xanthomonadales bacterium]
MDQELLLTLGEAGIALAGFSGIAEALQRRGQDAESRADRARLRDLLIASLGAAMFAFLPSVLTTAGMPIELALRHASAMLALYLLFAGATLLRGGTGRIGLLAWLFVLPAALMIVLLALVALGITHRVAAFAYVLTLFMLLILAAANFGVLLLRESSAAKH